MTTQDRIEYLTELCEILDDALEFSLGGSLKLYRAARTKMYHGEIPVKRHKAIRDRAKRRIEKSGGTTVDKRARQIVAAEKRGDVDGVPIYRYRKSDRKRLAQNWEKERRYFIKNAQEIAKRQLS